MAKSLKESMCVGKQKEDDRCGQSREGLQDQLLSNTNPVEGNHKEETESKVPNYKSLGLNKSLISEE